MRKFRTAACWDGVVLRQFGDSDNWQTHLVWLVIGLFAAGFFFALCVGLTPTLVWAGIPLAIIGFFGLLPFASMISPTYRIPVGAHYSRSGGRGKTLGRKYYRLPRADRALFPRNLLELMGDPDLTQSDRVKLYDHVERLLTQIKDRDRVLAAARRREVSIESAVEIMDHSNQSLKIEIDTTREFLDTSH